MTRMDDKIQINGASATITRDTGSVTDDYGDTTPIWTSVATEYVWKQIRSIGGNQAGIQGILDRAPYVIFLKSTTQAAELDMVTIGSDKYRIEKLNPIPMVRGEVSHYEADSRLVEEG